MSHPVRFQKLHSLPYCLQQFPRAHLPNSKISTSQRRLGSQAAISIPFSQLGSTIIWGTDHVLPSVEVVYRIASQVGINTAWSRRTRDKFHP